MKHRSIGVFILLAATLAAAPQASQELSALKNSVVGRVRAEFLQAFLNLQARGGAKPYAPRPAQLACDTEKKIAARKDQPIGKSVRRDVAPRRQTGAAPRPDNLDELAMIIDPNSPTPMGGAVASVELNLDDTVLGNAAGLLDEKISAGELAMIIPPSDDITRVADVRRLSPRAKRNSQPSVPTQYIATRAGQGGQEFLRAGEEARRELDEALRAAAEAGVEGDVERVKIVKLKRLGRHVATAGSAGKTPQPRKAPAPLWPNTDERHVVPAGE